MLVRRLLVKFYLLLFVSTAVLGLAVDHLIQNDESSLTNQQVQESSLRILEQSLSNLPINDRAVWLKSLELPEKMSVSLLAFDDISGDNLTSQSLRRGELVRFETSGKDILLRKLTNGEQILQLEFAVEEDNRFWLVLAFYGLLALPIMLWFWPLARDLKLLDRASRAISKKQFEHRIGVNKNSAIASISETFNQMADRIKYLIEEQKSLTSAVSHEIRTPLARLKFALELQRKNQTDTTQLAQIDAMSQDVEELTLLVDEMLSYAKLENVDIELEMQEVPAQAWLESVLDECRKSAGDIKVVSDCQIESLYIEPHLMARALSNLVLNAIRYAEREIHIALRSHNHRVLLSVSDDGAGIPEAQRERLFEPFAKLDPSRSKVSQGNGFGLAIVKRIVDKHHGTIEVSESELGGAEFLLTVPQLKT